MSANFRTSNQGVIEIIHFFFFLFLSFIQVFNNLCLFFYCIEKKIDINEPFVLTSRRFLNWWFSAKFRELSFLWSRVNFIPYARNQDFYTDYGIVYFFWAESCNTICPTLLCSLQFAFALPAGFLKNSDIILPRFDWTEICFQKKEI